MSRFENILMILAAFHFAVYVLRFAFARRTFHFLSVSLPILLLSAALFFNGLGFRLIHLAWLLPAVYFCNYILTCIFSYYRFRWEIRSILEKMETFFTKRHLLLKDVNANDFDWLDLDFYEKTTQRFGDEGFRHLSDRENVTHTEIFPDGRTFIRTLLSNDGTITVGICHVKTVDRLGNVSDDFRRIQFASVYSKNFFVVTNNYLNTPHFIVDHGLNLKEYPSTISVKTLLDHHRDRLKARTDIPDTIKGEKEFHIFEQKFQAVERKDRRHKRFMDEADLRCNFEHEESGLTPEMFDIAKKELVSYHEEIDDFIRNGSNPIHWIQTIIGTVVLAFFLAFGVYCIFGGLRLWYLSAQSPKWTTAAGVVLDGNVKRVTQGRSGSAFEPAISYRYTVNDKTYVGKRIVFAKIKERTKQDAEIYLRRYPVGGEIKIYYSPDNPAICVLDPGIRWRYISTVLFIGLFMTGFSQMFVRGIVSEFLLRRRQQRRLERFRNG